MDNFSPDASLPSSFPSSEPLAYEETPIIEPATPVSPSLQPAPPVPPKTPRAETRQSLPILPIVLLVVIFILGVWLSSFLRQFFPGGLFGIPSKQQTQATPTPIVTISPNPYANWKTYSVISGTSRKAVDGVSFKLPPEVSELFCDGVNCASQGTYLPGGTRFTIAVRGAGQILADYRGKIVTDFGGRPFVTTPMTVSARPGVGFVGDFTGSTVTGYTFTKMRGAMISVTDTLSLEVNHFTSSGIPADFAADDALFSKILDSFVFVGLPTSSLAPSLSPTTTPTATSSGS